MDIDALDVPVGHTSECSTIDTSADNQIIILFIYNSLIFLQK